MNKTIGYGASFLVIAGACGLLFGASQADAGYPHASPTRTPTPTGTVLPDDECEDKLDDLCACVDAALGIIKNADKTRDGKVKHADKVLGEVKELLKACADDICPDHSCD